ncbi:MAG: uroporphyrinogen decarboxylase family protein [Spirochaetaceae bacterium]|nr:uroporphyrinogen decarboxylase family protein [Spirochaetaceae bacterium]
MTGRERIQATLAHDEPDRVPLVLGPTNATGIKIEPYRELKRLLGIEAPDRYIYDWPELGTALLDEEALLSLGSDARGVLDRYPSWIYERARSREPHSPFIDDWGTGQAEVEPGKWYPGIHPMAEATRIEDIEAYPWPDMNDPSRLSGVRDQARSLAAEGEHAILGCPWLLFPFERAHAMQGLDRFLENMLIEPEFAQALLWKIEGLCKTLMGHFLDAAGADLDIIKIGDDLGTQESLMISPSTYREMLKPVHADLIAFIKSRTKAKVFFHSDGDVFDLVPDLVEIGVDILNPVQSGAGRMSDLARLKKAYGKDIVLCGAIDTQRVLPTGSPAEVRAEVKRVIDILAPGGGYMVSAVHTVMDGVSAENIIAMCDAVREYGTYPVRG